MSDRLWTVRAMDLAHWAMDQPDDRPLRMTENIGAWRGVVPCGCLMVQYAREVLKIPNELIHCGSCIFDTSIEHSMDVGIANLVRDVQWDDVRKFGDVKESVQRFIDKWGVT